MLDNPFRQILPRFTAPVIKFYEKLGVTPNQLTLAAFLCGVASAALIVDRQPQWAIVIWWVGRFLDGTDGLYARTSHQTTLFGAHLDIVCDMAAYSLMVIAFQYVSPQFTVEWIAMLFFYVLCITGALSLGILEKDKGLKPRDNRGLRLGAGLAEGGETGLAYTIFLLLPDAMPYTLWVWLAILLITVISRLVLAFRVLK